MNWDEIVPDNSRVLIFYNGAPGSLDPGQPFRVMLENVLRRPKVEATLVVPLFPLYTVEIRNKTGLVLPANTHEDENCKYEPSSIIIGGAHGVVFFYGQPTVVTNDNLDLPWHEHMT